MPRLDDVLNDLRTEQLRPAWIAVHPTDFLRLGPFRRVSGTLTLYGVPISQDANLPIGEVRVGIEQGIQIYGNRVAPGITGAIGVVRSGISVITDDRPSIDRPPIDPETYAQLPQRDWTRLPMPMPRTPVFHMDMTPMLDAALANIVESKPKEPAREPKTLWELLEDSDDNDP